MLTKTILFLSFFFTAFGSFANDTTKVLFIGNSITYFNNMPNTFESIANEKGKSVSVQYHAPGGTGIVHHYVNPTLHSLLRNQQWDIVVIQPGSSESAGVSYPIDTTAKRGQVLLDSIYQYSPCAEVYLYQIPYGISSSGGYSDYFTIQTMMRDSVLKLADSLNVTMIPSGECARAYYSLHQNLLLHNSMDDIHPNIYGSYLVAASFYAGIFEDSVTGSNYYGSIPQDTAQKFFSLVDSTIFNHTANWRIGAYKLKAQFSYTSGSNTISFNNEATNYTSIAWDFGDGLTSTVTNPTHSYAAPGIYNVTLYAYNGNCIDSVVQSIEVQASGVTDKIAENFTLYPNPATTSLTINSKNGENIFCVITNHLGQEVLRQKIVGNSVNQIQIAHLYKGVYFLELYDNHRLVETKKLLKL